MSELTQHFRQLEESLWRNESRESILSSDFTEFCRFGDVYDRDHLLKSDGAAEIEFPFERFDAERLTDDVVLVTYENVVNGERARRSSIWVAEDGSWKLRFMQATTLEN